MIPMPKTTRYRDANPLAVAAGSARLGVSMALMRCKARRWLAGLLVVGTGWAGVQAEDWPQWLGTQRDGVWREGGIRRSFPTNGLPVKWRAPVGAGYSGPAVAAGRVYLTDRPTNQQKGNTGGALDRTATSGTERIQCFDATTGRALWSHEYPCAYNFAYPSGPRATPAVANSRVFTLGAEGAFLCLAAESGKVLWARDFRRDYGVETQLWGTASSPLAEGDLVISLVGGTGHAVVAFDAASGREVWRALEAKEPGYSSPIIIEAGGKRQLIVWDTENLSSLDPATGRVYWSEPFKTKMGHSIGTPRRQGDWLLISAFFDGSMMMRLDPQAPKATVLWRVKGKNENEPAGLHSLMSTPVIEQEHIYGVCGYGQLRCLKAATGERVWESLAATTPDGKPARWATAFLVKHDDRHFIWNEKGDLILARLAPEGYTEISRAHLLEPTNLAGDRPVHWAHPAFANRCFYARNDAELICVDLAEPAAGAAATP